MVATSYKPVKSDQRTLSCLLLSQKPRQNSLAPYQERYKPAFGPEQPSGMKKERFEIGDEVRVIPYSYDGIAKGFLLYQELWEESQPESDQKIMLGGRYKILDLKRASSGTSYKLLASPKADNEFLNGLPLRKSNSVETCPFELGELIKFHPTCGEVDINYLLHVFDRELELSNPGKFYKVGRILNEYYIFIEDFEGREIKYPFRWQDFRAF